MLGRLERAVAALTERQAATDARQAADGRVVRQAAERQYQNSEAIAKLRTALDQAQTQIEATVLRGTGKATDV